MSEHEGGGSSSPATSKKHYVPQIDGASVQHAGLTSSARRAQQQSGGRIQQVIRNTGTYPVVNDVDWNGNHWGYRKFPFTGTPGLLVEPYDLLVALIYWNSFSLMNLLEAYKYKQIRWTNEKSSGDKKKRWIIHDLFIICGMT